MRTTSKAKGIAVNGEKLKDLRKKAGKTQKGLIRGTTIELRTYQRAEQGIAILPEILQQIAVILSVDTNEIRMNEATDKDAADVFRLYSVATAGGRKLLEALQDGNKQVDYDFDIDPTEELAGVVAEFIEHCEALAIVSDAWRPRLGAPEKIRAIGTLNDRARALAAANINIFFGIFYEWREIHSSARYTPDTLNDEILHPFTVTIAQRLRVVFSYQTSEFITGTFGHWSTRESAAQRAIKNNLEMGIDPEWLQSQNPFEFDDWFVRAYTQAYEERRPSFLTSNKFISQ